MSSRYVLSMYKPVQDGAACWAGHWEHVPEPAQDGTVSLPRCWVLARHVKYLSLSKIARSAWLAAEGPLDTLGLDRL